MKKLLFSFITLCMLSISTQAQSDADVDNFFQTIFSMEKQVLVESFINPSPETAVEFWEVYEAYETERKELGKQKMVLLQKYVDTYGNTSDEDVTKLVSEMISLNSSSTKLINKYFKKLKKVDAVEAGAFYQIESYIAAKVKAEILEQIPFFGEF